MGRHRSIEPGATGIARELLYSVVGIVIVLMLCVGWIVLREDNAQNRAEQKICPAGDLSIPYALLGSATSLSDIQEEYLSKKPHFQDYCFTEFKGVPVEKAALVYTAQTDLDTDTLLARVNLSPTSQHRPIVQLKDIGVAYPAGKAPSSDLTDWAEIRNVELLSEQPLAAAIANDAMRDKKQDTVSKGEAIEAGSAVVTVPNEVPAGYEFTVPDRPSTLHLPTRVLAVNDHDDINEAQSRAAADFIRFASDRVTKVEGPVLETMQRALAAHPLPTRAPAKVEPEPSDTLIMLDTSDGLSPMYDLLPAELAEHAISLSERGLSVGVWNYSSPIGEGVTRSYRENVPLDQGKDAAKSREALLGFGHGGYANTHESVVAALNSAQDYQKRTNRPVRVVLVTTGTDDAGAPGELATKLKDIDPRQVYLSVLHIGERRVDSEIADWALARGGFADVALTAEDANAKLNEAFAL